jgi:hypothetical protein
MSFLVTEVIYGILCIIVVAVGDFLPTSVLMTMAVALAFTAAPFFAVLSAMAISNESKSPLKWWGVAGYAVLFLGVNWFGIAIMYYLI